MVRKFLSRGASHVAPFFAKGFGLLLMLTAMSSSAMAVPLPGVPEIDPGSMATCVALLVGGMMLFGHSRWSAGRVKN